jgi:Tim10/DDP family zinc finger
MGKCKVFKWKNNPPGVVLKKKLFSRLTVGPMIAVHSLTNVCWKKCMTGTIRSGKLDKAEESCAQNCVERFLDGDLAVIKHLEAMRS